MIAGTFQLKRPICDIEWMSSSLTAAANKAGNYKPEQQILPAPARLLDPTAF